MRGIASLSKGVEKIEDFLKQASAAKDAAEAKKAKPARIDTAEISQKFDVKEIPEDIKEAAWSLTIWVWPSSYKSQTCNA